MPEKPGFPGIRSKKDLVCPKGNVTQTLWPGCRVLGFDESSFRRGLYCCSRWGFWGVFFHVDGFGFVAVGGGFSAVFVWICALSWAKFCCSSGGNRLCFLTIRLGLIGDSGKRKNGWY